MFTNNLFLNSHGVSEQEAFPTERPLRKTFKSQTLFTLVQQAKPAKHTRTELS
jgi:hypothetical protein